MTEEQFNHLNQWNKFLFSVVFAGFAVLIRNAYGKQAVEDFESLVNQKAGDLLQ